MSRHRALKQRRDWSRAVPVAARSRESGRFRGVLTATSFYDRWWVCTGHPPHETRQAALDCARQALAGKTRGRKA